MAVEFDAFLSDAHGVRLLIVVDIWGQGGFERLDASASRDIDVGEFFAEESEGLPIVRRRRESFEHPQRSFVVGVAHGMCCQDVANVFIACVAHVHEP